MAKEIRVPALGESVTEATIAKWFKNAGDAVKADEPLVELETDKVTVEVPAPASGRLASHRCGGGHHGECRRTSWRYRGRCVGAAPKAAEVAAPKKVEPIAAKSEAPLSPAVRKIVEENKIDTAAVSGSGKDGRMTKGDVIEHPGEARR